MAKLTVAEIKKQIAALEARAARMAEQETKASVDKVRALMSQLGVTLEHLSSTVVRKGAAVKKAFVGGKPAPAKRAGKGVAKYRDPKTGATWSGFGRAPGWIAGAANRDAFLVGKEHASAAAAKKSTVAQKAPVKRVSAKKVTKTSIKRAVTVTKRATSKASAAAAATKKPSIKVAAKKIVASKAVKKKAVSASPATALAATDSTSASAT